MSTYSNKNNKIYYNTYKSQGNAGNLLLIHDNGQSSKIFDSEIKFYSSYFTVITVDLSGHGKSQVSSDKKNNFWVSNAIAISELCEKIKFKKFSIIGIGGGGLVGLNIALINQDLVKNIFAESIPGLEPDFNYTNRIIQYRDNIKESDKKNFFYSLNGSKWEKILDEDSSMQQTFTENGGSYLIGDPKQINSHVLLAGSFGYDLVPDIEDRLNNISSSFKKTQVHMFSAAKYPLIINKNHEYRTVTLNYLFD
jgi:pimeloyl-ACP methyl ester carboxylesterase